MPKPPASADARLTRYQAQRQALDDKIKQEKERVKIAQKKNQLKSQLQALGSNKPSPKKKTGSKGDRS